MSRSRSPSAPASRTALRTNLICSEQGVCLSLLGHLPDIQDQRGVSLKRRNTLPSVIVPRSMIRTGEHCPRTGWWFPAGNALNALPKADGDSSMRARSCQRSESTPLTGLVSKLIQGRLTHETAAMRLGIHSPDQLNVNRSIRMVERARKPECSPLDAAVICLGNCGLETSTNASTPSTSAWLNPMS